MCRLEDFFFQANGINVFGGSEFVFSLILSKQRVCHTVALPFALKSILKQKKNDGNSNILPCKNRSFKKSSKRNQNLSRYLYNSITNLSSFNTSQNMIFQKSSYKSRPIYLGAKIPY
jgi:hypothetical protein